MRRRSSISRNTRVTRPDVPAFARRIRDSSVPAGYATAVAWDRRVIFSLVYLLLRRAPELLLVRTAFRAPDSTPWAASNSPPT